MNRRQLVVVGEGIGKQRGASAVGFNERITEDFVRDHFKNDPLFSAIKLDEQKSSVAKATGGNGI